MNERRDGLKGWGGEWEGMEERFSSHCVLVLLIVTVHYADIVTLYRLNHSLDVCVQDGVVDKSWENLFEIVPQRFTQVSFVAFVECDLYCFAVDGWRLS